MTRTIFAITALLLCTAVVLGESPESEPVEDEIRLAVEGMFWAAPTGDRFEIVDNSYFDVPPNILKMVSATGTVETNTDARVKLCILDANGECDPKCVAIRSVRGRGAASLALSCFVEGGE